MPETHFQLLRFQFIVLPEETPNLTFSCMSNAFVPDFFVAYSLVICFSPAFSIFAGHDLYALYMFNYHVYIWFIACYSVMPLL